MHALVTGASSGIGEALALRLADAGYDISLVARRRSRLEAVAKKIAESCRAHVIEADVSELTRIGDVLADARETLGPIDALINNAGIQIVKRTPAVTVEDGERLLTINVLAPFRFTLGALPEMLERGRGVIVDIASVAALAPTPAMFHYNASKAALAAASESLRAEVAPKGVHVVTVYPGPVKTAMADAALAKYGDSSVTQGLPTGTPDELAVRIVDAMHNQAPRVIYPATYTSARHFPGLTRWIMDRFSPLPGTESAPE